MVGGLEREGIARIESCIATLPASAPLLRARLGVALSLLYKVIGRFQECRQAAESAAGFARVAGDGPTLASALIQYAHTRVVMHDFAAAEAALREADSIPGISRLLRSQLLEEHALLSMNTGDLDAAAQSFARLRDQFRSLGEQNRNEAIALSDLAEVEFRREQYARAADLGRECIAIFQSADEPGTLCDMIVFLGSALAMGGDFEAASTTAIQALTLLARWEPDSLDGARGIELRAYLVAIQGGIERAARLAGYADSKLAPAAELRRHVDQKISERLTTLLKERLAPDALASLTAEGAMLTSEAALALARE